MHLHGLASLTECEKYRKNKKQSSGTMWSTKHNCSQLSDDNKASKSLFEIRAGAFDFVL